MALFERGSTFTLYGGSVLTRWIFGPVEQPIHVLGLAAVAAQQPVVAQDHRSPGLVVASSGGSGISSSTISAVRRSRAGVLRQLLQHLPQAPRCRSRSPSAASELAFVRLGHRRQRIERRQHLVGFVVVQVHDQDRHLISGVVSARRCPSTICSEPSGSSRTINAST